MRCGNIDFPESIISALKNNKLVVFAGAGVSMGPPACLENFEDLAKKVAENSACPREDGESVDQFLGRIEANGVKVRQRVRELLQPTGHTPLHTSLVRLFTNVHDIRIVTTNFEHLFESASSNTWQECPRVYDAPALPLGNSFAGIVHVHGNLSVLESLVLTDDDFGRAYLTEGWARRFLVALFQEYTVLFVGYSHGDTVLSYLARALPPTTELRRFSLIEEGDNPSRWRHLGIEPISFATHANGNYFNLDDGVRNLADFRQRGVLEWKQDLQKIAKMEHPLPPDKHDHLNQLLREEWAVKLFTEHAKSIRWLTWFQSEGHLAKLFTSEELDGCALEFARILPMYFALEHSASLQLLCAQNRLRLNHVFWRSIARELSLSDEIPEGNVFCSWLTLLLSCETEYRDPHMLARLAKRASELQLPWCLLDILELMLSSSLVLKPGLNAFESDEKVSPRVSMRLGLHSDWGPLHDVWGFIEPHLDDLADPLSRLLIAQAEKRFRMYVYYGSANSHWDPDTMSKSAIEPHSQDKHPRSIHALIDALRDTLTHICKKFPERTIKLATELADSRVPLLRRMATHLVAHVSDEPGSTKLQWIVQCVRLNDVACHHEIFLLLACCYPRGDDESRKLLVQTVTDLEVENGTRDDSQIILEHFQFTMLAWLSKHSPDCCFVQNALELIREHHPNWLTPQHPEFNHYMSGGFVRTKSPWTKEELLSQPPDKWIVELLRFQSEDSEEEAEDIIVQVSREGLWEEIAQASNARPDWGVQLAQILVARAEWHTDLWYGLFRSWENWSGDRTSLEAIARVLARVEILQAHSLLVAKLIRSFVGLLYKDDNRCLDTLLCLVDRISQDLWQALPRDLVDKNTKIDWVRFALNTPAGLLVESWVQLHSHVRHSDDMTEYLRKYEDAFQNVVDDDSQAGGAGRTTLFRYLSYIQNSMPEWTRNYLLPMLVSTDSSIFRQSWHGVLTSRRISDDLWAEIRGAVLNVTVRLAELTIDDFETPSDHQFMDEFTDFFTDCVLTFEAEPLNEWIPRLYRYTSEDTHLRFAHRVCEILKEDTKEERQSHWTRWLRTHWKARLQGIPASLQAKEAGAMVTWLLHLEFEFSDAVEIACQSTDLNLEHTHLFWDLGNSELPLKYPDDTARLLCRILELNRKATSYVIYDLSVVMEKLLPSLSSGPLRLELKQRVIESGMRWPVADSEEI